MTLQYLKEKGRGELYFLHAHEDQTFLQIDPIDLDVWPGMPELLTLWITVYNISRKN